MVKKLCGFVISSMLITAFFDNNNKTAATTNNTINAVMTKAGSMMMENKTTANADTLMTKIRNMGNATIGGGGGSSTVNMTNASTANNMMIRNKSG